MMCHDDSPYRVNSLRRTFNPISATNLFPDETPDTDRAGSTTEPAYFSDIGEDDPSPHDDEPPSIDDDVPAIRVVTNAGNTDTGDTAPVPHTDVTIGDTNNPDGTHGAMPTGPNDDTHVTNSNTTASPFFGDTAAAIQPNPEPTQRSVHTVSTHTTNDGASAITMDVGPHDDISTFLLHIRRAADDAASSLSHNVIVNPGNVDAGGRASTPPTDMTIDSTNKPTDAATSPTLKDDTATSPTLKRDAAASPTLNDSGTNASPTLKRKRKYAPARAAQRQCKRWEGRRDLDDTARIPDSGGAQAGGDGEGRA